MGSTADAETLNRDGIGGEDEFAPLLPDGTEPLLYRTVSVCLLQIIATGNDLMLTLSQKRSTLTSPQLPVDDSDLELAKGQSSQQQNSPSPGVYATISVMLLGTFVAQIDTSLVLATYNTVASDFDALSSASWLLSSFILAQCVAQPLYGKLSDIYGRKACLQTAYLLFAIGTAGTGLGQTMGQVIAWRAVQGAGSAGMTSMVGIIITDLVPLHEVATIRSYVNILQTSGRSCGGVIGGALTYSMGWRFSFLVQVPPTILSILLVQWRLKLPSTAGRSGLTQAQKLKRVDFAGSIFLCTAIFAACFILETGGQRYPWKSNVILAMVGGLVVALVLFVTSSQIVAEPVFPLRVLKQWAVTSSYIIAFLQILVQFSLMTVVPLYWQVTNKANTAQAGAYLIPAFIGNTMGGHVSGYYIKSTGRYKPMTVVSPFFAIMCMCLCYFCWKGHNSSWASLAILPGGLAAGMVSSSVFVGLAAGVTEADLAVAASGLYLFCNLGAVAGASAGGAVFQTSLKAGLKTALKGVTNGSEVSVVRD